MQPILRLYSLLQFCSLTLGSRLNWQVGLHPQRSGPGASKRSIASQPGHRCTHVRCLQEADPAEKADGDEDVGPGESANSAEVTASQVEEVRKQSKANAKQSVADVVEASLKKLEGADDAAAADDDAWTADAVDKARSEVDRTDSGEDDYESEYEYEDESEDGDEDDEYEGAAEEAATGKRTADYFLQRADYYLQMANAIKLSDGAGLQPFSAPQAWMSYEFRAPKQVFSNEEFMDEYRAGRKSLNELVEACVDRAPDMLTSRDSIVPLARLASWTRDRWVRPLEDWPGEGINGTLRSLTAHLLETWEVPPVLHSALAYTDGPPISEAAHRISRAFLEVQAAAGRGDSSVLDALRLRVSPAMSKTIAKEFVKIPAENVTSNPLHALRRAEVSSLKGGPMIADAVCDSELGRTLLKPAGEGKTEEFALSIISWLCTHEEEFESQFQASSLLDYFLEMVSIESNYTVAGRSPKKLRKRVEEYVATTFQVDEDIDERFQKNPRGIVGWYETDVRIEPGTIVENRRIWGTAVMGEDGEFFRPDVMFDLGKFVDNIASKLGVEKDATGAKATIRIAEILSLQRMIYEGNKLNNCLEGSYRSQVKYLSRVRNRESSFWSLTKQVPGGEVEHLCLIEVWHLRSGNEIRQAEGPRPGTLPGPEAWHWMDKWCTREGIDLSTWDCYS